MGFHKTAAGVILTARVWSQTLDGTNVFDTQRVFWGSVAIVFVFTLGAMWASDDFSFVENPVAYGTQFQETFIETLLSAMVVILAAGLFCFGLVALIGLTAMGPVTCQNTELEDLVACGNWAAALELADRFRKDPVQRNFWRTKAQELGHDG